MVASENNQARKVDMHMLNKGHKNMCKDEMLTLLV